MTDLNKTQTATQTDLSTSLPIAGAANLPALIVQSQTSKVVDRLRLTADQQQVAQQIADAVNFEDGNTIGLFASAPMQDYSKILNQLLEGVRMGDIGEAGAAVSEGIRDAMKEMRIKGMQSEMKPWSFAWMRANLPIVGKYLSAIYYFHQRRQKFLDVTDKMERDAKNRIRSILEYLIKTQKLVVAVENQYNALAVYIVAGEQALERGIATFEQLKAQAIASGDAMLYNQAHTYHENLMAFDTRLLRVKQAYAKAPVTGQQIRLGQSAGRTTVQNIQNALDFTMADLKAAIIQVAGLYEMKKSQEAAAELDRAEAAVQGLQQEMLGEVYLGAKKTQGEGLERVKRLAALMDKVADLTKQGIELDKQNQAAREEAERYLVDAMSNYKQAMEAMGQKSPFDGGTRITG